MKSLPLLRCCCLLCWLCGSLLNGQLAELGNQALARKGLVDATAAPFNADPSGVTDSTDAINAALLFGREHHLVTYLPVGDYTISGTIHLAGRNMQDADSSMNDYFCVLQGETHIPGKRSRLILAPSSPGFGQRNPVPIVVHAYYPNGEDFNYTSHFNQVIRSVDIIIGEGNSGAVGLRHQGAEGTLIEDVMIDATHGWKGVWGVPGSGGSTHRLTVIGGEIGIDLRGFALNGSLSGVGTQPGPSLSQIRLHGQTEAAMPIRTRGSVTLVGAEIISSHAAYAFSLQPQDISQPWNNALSVIDTTVDLSGGAGARELVRQLAAGGMPGRGYVLSNVYTKGIQNLDGISALSTNAERWTRFRELAVAGQPARYQGLDLQEVIMVDGAVQSVPVLVEQEAGVAPDTDFVAYHGWGQTLPTATLPSALDIMDYGADPTGEADSTAAIQAAIDSGRDVFIPKGTFKVTDTLRLRPATRLFGIHPMLSHLQAQDSMAEGRFAGLVAGSAAVPMVESADAADARTVLSMLALQIPRAVANHSPEPVLVYPLKWQSGRYSILHHLEFSPHSQNPWRLQLVMQRAFFLAQELGSYQTGGLRYASNDSLERIFIETFNDAPRLSLPFVPEGSTLRIRAEDGQPFDIGRLDIGKATFGDGIAFAVTLTGLQSDGTQRTQRIEFASGWTDRSALKPVELDWQGLAELQLTAPLPFSVGAVTSSRGEADFAKRRPFYVLVDCGDMRRGFEHFPFAALRHPLVQFSGNGGGRWYNAFYHGDIWAAGDFSLIEVRDTREPLNIYAWHLQHVHSDSQAVFRNARYVSVFGIKSEHNSRFLSVYDSDHIRIFGWAGLADARIGGSHFYFENTPNFLHAAMSEENHYNFEPEVLSSCDNPLIVHHISLFDGIQENFEGMAFRTPEVTRTIYYKRGAPLSETTLADYAAWAQWQNLSGDAAQAQADPFDLGYPNLLRYAMGFEQYPWLAVSAPLEIAVGGGAVLAQLQRPLRRPDVRVHFQLSDAPPLGPESGKQLLAPRGDPSADSNLLELPLSDADSAFLRLVVERMP